MKCKCCGQELNGALLFLHEAVYDSPYGFGNPLQMVPYASMPELAAIMERYAAVRLEEELARLRAVMERKA